MPIAITHAHASKVSTPGRIYDTHPGLHLWVKTPNRKYWIYRNAKGGKRTDVSLGSFPSVGVAEARQKASELARTVTADAPLGVQAAKRRQPIAEPVVVTFAEFARQLIETKRPEWRNEKHASQWVNTLDQYAHPFIGHKSLVDITTDDVLLILNPIWVEKTETATRLRGRLERILAAATTKGLRNGVNPAQWRGHLDCLLPQPKKLKKVRHHPALPYAELPEFIEQLQGRSGTAALALEFCILTASRTSEVLNARKNEVVGAMWTIPADRMKAGKDHSVPLSPRAQQLIAKAAQEDPNSEFLFSIEGSALSNMALLALLRRMNYRHITTHGFRSTFRDWVSEETDFSPEVAEMCLAHTIANKVEAAYRRGNLFEKRRRLLEAWASHCTGGSCNIHLLKAA